MSNRTIFGLPVDILSASNMTVTSSAPDGKYVLKAGDSMSGDLKMEGGADIAIQNGGNYLWTGKPDCIPLCASMGTQLVMVRCWWIIISLSAVRGCLMET